MHNLRDCFTARELISQLGYRVKIHNSISVRIQESQERLFELGLALSKIDDIQQLRNRVLENRESLLEKLLEIPGESENEEPVRSFLLDYLPNILDTVWKDAYGNILGIKSFGIGRSPAILLSAHMDVIEEFPPESTILKEGNIWTRSEGVLGADDRAGIAMILNILQDLSSSDFRRTIKVAFTVEEETEQYGAEKIDPDFFADVHCAISLDRHHGNDIVTGSPRYRYCDEDYGKVFEHVSRRIWGGENDYQMTGGGISDLRVWSQRGIPSVNLSVGFHHEHTDQETLNLTQWHNTHDLVFSALYSLRGWHLARKQLEKKIGLTDWLSSFALSKGLKYAQPLTLIKKRLVPARILQSLTGTSFCIHTDKPP